ncbi:tyrosine-protein phosphatase non-receptor type substrate 1-like [Peromyscus eremicus]|uniref:tyrosine-protein phosphatase non-receptor type substrate 1-like n=1 Tax=Peromyscus eremicus TaxID=42410 RepID=UPI0027DB3B21|nr:tyrosine-protein phosphatase non-receptor type substrate 1-like [Peromyscus eremicus]
MCPRFCEQQERSKCGSDPHVHRVTLPQLWTRKQRRGENMLFARIPPSAKPSPPVVSGPAGRVSPGQTVSFTCKSHGFFPWTITLKWFKDGNELPHFRTTVDPKGESVSYNLSSTAQVVLSPQDVHSQVICEVAHVTLQGGPLRGTANLSDTIRELKISDTAEILVALLLGPKLLLVIGVIAIYMHKKQKA